MHIGSVITLKREALAITRNTLAERSGVEGSYLRRLELGLVQHPSWHTICRLADVLGCSLDELRRKTVPIHLPRKAASN